MHATSAVRRKHARLKPLVTSRRLEPLLEIALVQCRRLTAPGLVRCGGRTSLESRDCCGGHLNASRQFQSHLQRYVCRYRTNLDHALTREQVAYRIRSSSGPPGGRPQLGRWGMPHSRMFALISTVSSCSELTTVLAFRSQASAHNPRRLREESKVVRTTVCGC